MSDLIGFEPPKIDWSPGPDLVQRLKRFKQKCQLLFEGPLKARTDEQKCRYLLLWAGDYGLDLFNTWNLSDSDKNKPNEYWRRFEEHVQPQANHILNRYYLRNLKQNGRPLDDFLTEARLLIQSSGYPDTLHDEILRDTLVFGVDSDIIRKKCITEGNDLTYQKAREIARTDEATRMQLEAMATATATPTQVNSLQRNKENNKGKTKPFYNRQKGQMSHEERPRPNQNNSKSMCSRCGNAPHDRGQKCPASNSKCFGCHKIGHFRHMCKSTRPNVNSLESDTFDEYETDHEDRVFLGTLLAEQLSVDKNKQVGNINTHKYNNNNKVITELHMTAKPFHKRTTSVTCKIDTGAELNVMSEEDYFSIVPNPKHRELGPPRTKITAYGGHEIENIGTCQLYIHHNKQIKPVEFSITKVKGPSMLGCETSRDLGLVQFHCGLTCATETQPPISNKQPHTEGGKPLTKESLIESFPDRFEGLGTFTDMEPYHIILDPEAQPVIHPPRSVPVHLHDLYKQELDSMLQMGVISAVEGPTDWVNSIVLNETTNEQGEITKLRICLDPRDLNKFIKREYYYSRTVDEVVTELNSAKFFTLVDARKGYWHVPLDEASSYLTTFSTPFGRFRFNRLPFGLVVSQDVFQKQLDASFEGLVGVTGIADDTFVYGSTEKEHDRNLVNLMQRAIEKGITFNKAKLQFKCKEISFFGHTWTPEGVKPDNKKVSAILDMEPPPDVKTLQSFLGLVNYLTRYSSKLATLAAPLRDLTKKGIAYSWGPEHDHAFNEVKAEISTLGILRYFDPKAETVIQTDASLRGLGPVLLQDGQPVCYASKALTETVG